MGREKPPTRYQPDKVTGDKFRRSVSWLVYEQALLVFFLKWLTTNHEEISPMFGGTSGKSMVNLWLIMVNNGESMVNLW